MTRLYVRSEGQDFRNPDFTLATSTQIQDDPEVRKLVKYAYDKGRADQAAYHESNARWESISKYGDMGT